MLMDWWSKNTYGKQLFIGHGIYRTLEARKGTWKSRKEIPNQIKALRENKNVHGSVFFSSKTFESNPNGWNDSLQNNYYQYPAIVPPMLWIDSIAPIAPLIENIDSNLVRIYYRGAEKIKQFALYKLQPGIQEIRENATLFELITADKTIDIDLSEVELNENEKLYVSVVDRNNNVSSWVKLR